MNYEVRIKNYGSTSPSPLQAWRGWLKARRGRIISVIILGLSLNSFWLQPVIAPETPLPIREPKVTTVVAVGDIMLSRQVGARIEKAGDPGLPFLSLREILSSADITFGNLECPLSENPLPGGEGLVFRCPSKYAEALRETGFDILSTANNHSFDQGVKGIDFTIDYLLSQGILPLGTSPSPDGGRVASSEVERPGGVIERNDIKFGFLAYSYSAKNDGGRSAHPQISTMNPENLKQDIENLSAKGGSASGGKSKADIIVVSMHAGTEYTHQPNQQQIDFAHAAVDSGADIVIGHHPHWIQSIEIYQNKPIFYSLGNFVFDQMWSVETREGLLIKLNIKNKKLKSAELIPIIIDNYCCPRLADEEEKAVILKKINLETDIINTQ